MKLERYYSEIYKRYGNVTRARGCFLYTEKGVRLTDLYQENGRAILGWGGGKPVTDLKNVLARGVTGSFDTVWNHRLEKAVSALLGGERLVAVLPTKAEALRTALALSPDNAAIWRPWLPAAPDWAAVDAVVLEPPLAWSMDSTLLACTPGCVPDREAFREADRGLVPPLAAAVTRSLYDLRAALAERTETDWFRYDTVLHAYWERKGPYLYPRSGAVDAASWPAFVCHCLDCGLVINPSYEEPSIVPYGADCGVFRKLLNTPFSLTDR